MSTTTGSVMNCKICSRPFVSIPEHRVVHACYFCYQDLKVYYLD